MRRVAPFLLLAFVLAGCGGEEVVSPSAESVVGPVAAKKQKAGGAGKPGPPLFAAQGGGGCHVFKPANSQGNVGPDLDKLADYAKTANQGSLEEFTHESIANPSADIEKGYPNSIHRKRTTLNCSNT